MSGEILTKIKAAEAEADKIREAAQAQARAKIKDTEERGKKLCDECEVRVSAECEGKLDLIRAKADEMMNANRESAKEAAAADTSAASLRLREAIRYIIGGVIEECQ